MARIKVESHLDTEGCRCTHRLGEHWFSGFACNQCRCEEFRHQTTGARDKRWAW